MQFSQHYPVSKLWNGWYSKKIFRKNVLRKISLDNFSKKPSEIFAVEICVCLSRTKELL